MGTRINELSAVDAVQAGDQFVVYDASNGDSRKASVTVVADYMQANLTFDSAEFTTQREAPDGFGFNVTTPSNANTFVILIGSSAENCAIALPVLANCSDKQEILVSTVDAITALSVNEGTGTSKIGDPTSLAIGGFFKMRFDLQTATWYRVG